MNREETTIEPTAATLPPAPPAGTNWRKRLLTKKFLFLSIAAHLFFGMFAAVWIVQINRTQRKHTFAGPPATSNPSSRALEHQVQMAKKKNTMSAPQMVKRVTTSANAKLALPPVPKTAKNVPVVPMQVAGMGGPGFGTGAGGSGTGGTGHGGGLFMASIGGMKVQAQKLGVALDVSGSVKQYQAEMEAYVSKVFQGCEVEEFHTAGFMANQRGPSMGDVVLGFLNSPKKFDAIYIFSDFGETQERFTQDMLPEVQKQARAKKVRLYLHVLRPAGQETSRIDGVLTNVMAFAKSTGGSVKVGVMSHAADNAKPGL